MDIIDNQEIHSYLTQQEEFLYSLKEFVIYTILF